MKFLDAIKLNPAISIPKEKVCPFISMENVDFNLREPLAYEMKAFSSGVKFEDGDTVIARITPCLQNGKSFYCKKIGQGFGSTEFLVFRPQNKAVDNSFLYYYLRTFNVRQRMINSMVGATGRQRVNNDVFKSMEVDFPDINTQRRIADILSAYDDLIENNRKQIKLLEEAAQRLYKEWFVDLRFPGHEKVKVTDGVPEGWERKPISGIAPIVTGKKDANYGTENGKYLFFTCSQEPLKADGYSFDGDAVILAGNGDFSVRLYRGKFEAYQRTYVLIPNEKKMLYLLYFAIKQELAQLFQGASGSTIKFLTKGMIEKILLFVPPKNILDLFNDNLENLQTKMEKAKQQICLAQEARDRLLPKLMNGEIEVCL